MPLARISLTLSRHFSLSFIASSRSSEVHPVSHIAAVCMFTLVVLLLLGHMWGSKRVHHLWACPCFSSSVLHVWFPGGNTQQGTNYTATCLPSQKLSKLDELFLIQTIYSYMASSISNTNNFQTDLFKPKIAT